MPNKAYWVMYCLFSSVLLWGESRTVCGSNDMEKMISLNDKMQAMGRPIGNLRGSGSCSGVMISDELFLTAGHCKSSCSSMKVTFDYLSREKETFDCKEIVESGSGGSNLDYMVIRLKGYPGKNWGWYSLSDEILQKEQSLLMIHHPSGSPMKVSRKNCAFKKESGGFLYHNCDTEPGSSGSAVLLPDYNNPENTRVVAVHTLGGCNSSSTSYNSGPTIANIAKKSALIRSMIKNDEY